jgi:uncharacterized membrane protein
LTKKNKDNIRRADKSGFASSIRSKVESAPPAVVRIAWIDAWRGVAIALMIAYHFCFDLSYFHVLHADLNHEAFWIASRSLIVSMFLTLVGISLVLSSQQGLVLRRFATRQLRIGACAVLVSAGSYAMFPATFIYFGILHFIFFASLIGMALLRGRLPGAVFAVAGALSIYAALQWSSPVFDTPPLQWIGFMTYKPATEDYVPLFPWIGVVLLGIAAGQWLLARLAKAQAKSATDGAAATKNPIIRAGAWMGRHSLLIYMLHQPILLGFLYLLFGR